MVLLLPGVGGRAGRRLDKSSLREDKFGDKTMDCLLYNIVAFIDANKSIKKIYHFMQRGVEVWVIGTIKMY